MPSDYLHSLCTSAPSVASELAKAPDQTIDSIIGKLRKEFKLKTKVGDYEENNREKTARDELDHVAACGKFPHRPSDLFLRIFSDVLKSLERDPFANLASPSVVGTSGVVPLSIVSVIPDIMQHYAALLVRAKHEVFLATNYWENSHSSSLISDALRQLSNRDSGVIVKLMYDRGTPSQILHNHAAVPPEKWSSVGLPAPEELQGIKLEVVNYHRPPLGTFHAKYLIVDRKVAVLNSNNIQDRPNVEMMVHLEGDIVESFYDVALFSWANVMVPPLPLLKEKSADKREFRFGQDNEYLRYIDTEFASKAARELLGKQVERDQFNHRENAHSSQEEPQAENDFKLGQAMRTAMGIHGTDEGIYGKDELIGEHPAMNLSNYDIIQDKSDDGYHEGLTERRGTSSNNECHSTDQANSSSHDGNSFERLELRQDRVREAGNSNGQAEGSKLLSPDEASTSSENSRVSAITKHLNAAILNECGTVKDDELTDEFQPHIIHVPHKPVPMALVNRSPTGRPGHENVKNVPQNVAWLSGLAYAEKSVFIQSPTLNASPVIPAVLDACRRGIEVTLYLDLGFNDLGEMIPFQGGTNEQVVHNMYKTLNTEGKGVQKNLGVYWYTAKDQKEPMSASRKSRNCHVKFMSVDDQVTIVGNGNQDTQSWFHSQEVNIMVDSSSLALEWLAGINANQNTRRYGLVSDLDGIWRTSAAVSVDGVRSEERVIQSSGIEPVGFFGALKGLSGAIKRLRGTGGF